MKNQYSSECTSYFDNKLKKLSVEKLEEIIAKSIGDALGTSFKCTLLRLELANFSIGQSILNLALAEDQKKARP